MLNEKRPYNPRVYVRSWNIRNGKLYVKGELQISVPLDFYYRHMTRFRGDPDRLYGGVDVNTDRINLAIIDSEGRLRDTYAFWFREVIARGFPQRKARTIIGMRIHELLKCAYHHGVKTLFLENPDVLGRLKLLWIWNGARLHSNFNRRVAIFI